jgi:hypothetical protein
MKLILSIILLFFITNSTFSQEYLFDLVVKSKFTTRSFPNQEHTDLFNSNDFHSYHMQIYSRNDSLIARIFDKKEAKRHIFYIDKADSLRPVFVKTEILKRSSNEYYYEYSTIDKSKDSSEIKFGIQTKRKKASYILTIDKTDNNYFPIYSNAGGLEELFYTDVKPPFNCTVLKSEGTNLSGNHTKYELVSINKINLKVIIPPNKDKMK